jgi:hypothetical protein
MGDGMKKSEIRRIKAIIGKQNKIKEAARIKRNIRLLGLREMRLSAEQAKRLPKLRKGRSRIKDRHLMQMVLGSLSDHWLEEYNARGITPADVDNMVKDRPAVLAKLKALGVAVEELPNG